MSQDVIFLKNDLRSGIARYDALYERFVRHIMLRLMAPDRFQSLSMAREFGFETDGNLANQRYVRFHDDDALGVWRELDLSVRHLWITHEAPPSVLTFLDEQGQDYIEFRLSPLRYANDLLLAVRSNHAGIAEKMKSGGIGLDECLVAADLLRLRARLRAGNSIKPELSGSAIVLGQLGYDLSLIDETTGQQLALQDFEAQLREAIGDRKVFYKPHPYASGYDVSRDVDLLKQLFGPDVSTVNDNIYDLFTHLDRALFVALSSGALQEADLFGFETFCLHKPYVPLAASSRTPDAAIYHQIAFSEFTNPTSWAHWLDLPAFTGRQPLYLEQRDVLRGLYRNSWGFWPHWDEQEMRDFDDARSPRKAAFALTSLSFDHFSHLMHKAFGDSGVVHGQWRWFTGWTVAFNPDGVFTINDNEAGRYVFFGGGAVVLYYREAELRDLVWLSGDGLSLAGYSSKNIQVSATRI